MSSYAHNLFITPLQQDDTNAKNYLIPLSFCRDADANHIHLVERFD